MSGDYWIELMEGKTDKDRKVYEGYLKGIQTLMTGKPLLEFSEEELYNGITNGTALQKDKPRRKADETHSIKPLAKYIKTAYINLCILMREKNGLTTEFLRSHTKRRTAKQ